MGSRTKVAAAALGTAAVAAGAAGRAQHHRVAALREFAEGLPSGFPDILPPAREYTVVADDGVDLSVEELDPVDGGTPELTAIFLHGFTLDRRSWLFQRDELARSRAPRVRQVLYDHRSHGRSGRSPRDGCTIEQLGRDLHAVIRRAASEGPVVLIGHSLGGMTVMALAEECPELFAERICGVAFINTSAGDVAGSGLPWPVLSRRSPVIPVSAWLSRWKPCVRAIELGRHACRNLLWKLTGTLSFGGKAVNPALVDLMDTMISAASFDVMISFLPTQRAHHRYAALEALRHVTALVIGSDRDRLFKHTHAEAIAALLPDAVLVLVEGSGHVAMLEHPGQVNEHLVELLSRCAKDSPQTASR
ncbi:MAG: alpha/beta fold hydrolase [Pseudonocardiaceae bacterium]